MKVLLVVPPNGSVGVDNITNAFLPPLGLASLAASLRQHDIPVEIFDSRAFNMNWEGFKAEIVKRNPDIVGIGADTPMVLEAYGALEIIKQADTNIVTVAGGPHFSFCYEKALQKGFDYVVRFEGEETLVELIKTLEQAEPTLRLVRGIAFLEGDTVITTPLRDPADINELPSPAWDLLPMERYHWWFRKPRNAMLMTSRGCNHCCLFCTIPRFWGRYRAMSAERVIDEVELLIKDYGVEIFWFDDDNFLGDIPRMEEFLRLLDSRSIKIKWFFQARADDIYQHRELLREAYRLGARMVLVGAESSSQEILNSVKKGVKSDIVDKAIRFLQDTGYAVWASFLLTPEDNKNSIKDAVKYAASLNSVVASFSPWTPYPGTEAWKPFEDKDPVNYLRHDMYVSPEGTKYLSKGQFEIVMFWAYLRYYMRPAYFKHLISSNILQRKAAWCIIRSGAKEQLQRLWKALTHR